MVAPIAPVPQLPIQPESRRALEPDRAEKAKSVAAAADCLAGEDWVKVRASRRNSQLENKASNWQIVAQIKLFSDLFD